MRGTIVAFAVAVALFAAPALTPPVLAAENDAPQRVVSVGADVTATVLALQGGEQIVAVDSTSATLDGALSLPVVGYMRTLTPEGILALNPDLLLATEGSGPPATLDQLTAAGVPVALIDTEPTLDGAAEKVRLIGEKLGRGDAAEELVGEMRQDEAVLEAELAEMAPAPRVIFVLSAGRGAPLVSGTGTTADAMIKLAGATNAMGHVPGYKPMGLETAVAAEPDVVLATQRTVDQLGGETEMLALPVFASFATQPRLVLIDGEALVGLGPTSAKTALALAYDLRGAQQGEPQP